VNDFEAAGQALGQSPLQKEGRRPEQDDLQGPSGTCVSIPEAFHRFGPAGHLLDFIQDQNRSPLIALAEQEARGFPLRVEPVRSTQRWFVGAGEDVRYIRLAYNLRHKRRLADLAGAGHDLNEAALFAEAPEQLGSVRSPVGGIAHGSE
jgi:hypothetical protein